MAPYHVQFNQLMRSDDVQSLILADVEEAKDLGIFFTPMIFINGVELKWYSIPSSLSSTINRIATAIEDGSNDGLIKAPPEAKDKYILDWQEGRRRAIPNAVHAPWLVRKKQNLKWQFGLNTPQSSAQTSKRKFKECKVCTLT